MNKATLLLFALIMADESLSGCGKEPQSRSSDSGQVTIVGKVRRLEDNVPADGGVTIEIAQDKGGVEILYFGSLFTVPRPSEERTQLYEKIRRVTTGDRIEAKGKRRRDAAEFFDLLHSQRYNVRTSYTTRKWLLVS